MKVLIGGRCDLPIGDRLSGGMRFCRCREYAARRSGHTGGEND
nr:MAG TPA: GcrA cell cycle regulator [Caudoviricetes sp.]